LAGASPQTQLEEFTDPIVGFVGATLQLEKVEEGMEGVAKRGIREERIDKK